MRKLFIATLLSAAIASTAFRCDGMHDNDDVRTQQTINKTLLAGESFTQALPGDADDVYKPTMAPMHASASVVAGLSYSYTAASGYTGTDKVVLLSTEEHGGNNGGRCKRHHSSGNQAEVTINITIIGKTEATASQ